MGSQYLGDELNEHAAIYGFCGVDTESLGVSRTFNVIKTGFNETVFDQEEMENWGCGRKVGLG
mgnify:CR=1 FL=1